MRRCRPRGFAVPGRGTWVAGAGLMIVAAFVVAGVSVEAQEGQGERSEAARRRARHASLTAGLDCSACHGTDGWELTGATGAGGFDHALTGFPLTGQHGRLACASCHQRGLDIARDCSSCHEDRHRRRLGQTCDSCHDASGWSSTETHAMHRRGRFPLTGMHALADCSQCHQRSDQGRYSDAPVHCYGCHAEDYLRSDVHPVHSGIGGRPRFPTDCSLCHQTVAFSPAFVDPTMLPRTAGLRSAGLGSQQDALRAFRPREHDLHFPITFGAHRGVACASCHTSASVTAAVECAGCHAHNTARLAVQHRGRPVARSGLACLSCHRQGSRR